MASPFYGQTLNPGGKSVNYRALAGLAHLVFGPLLGAYQRTRLAPQVKPPPIASIRTRWPGRMRPSPTASASASGIDAAEVFACRSMVTTTLLPSSPSLRPMLSMMRRFAWGGARPTLSPPGTAVWPDAPPAPSGERGKPLAENSRAVPCD